MNIDIPRQMFVPNYTFSMIKPNVTKKGKELELIDEIQQDFIIIEQKRIRFTRDLAERFYAEHKGKNFFKGLIDFMTSGETILLVLKLKPEIAEMRLQGLEKSIMSLNMTTLEDAKIALYQFFDLVQSTAVDYLRAKIGAVDKEGTYRHKYADSYSHNAIHGSDSLESAKREIQFFYDEILSRDN